MAVACSYLESAALPDIEQTTSFVYGKINKYGSLRIAVFIISPLCRRLRPKFVFFVPEGEEVCDIVACATS